MDTKNSEETIVEFRQKLDGAIIQLLARGRSIKTVTIAKYLSIEPKELSRKIKKHDIFLSNLIGRLKHDYKKNILPNTKIQENQIIWNNKILTISYHAIERLQERTKLSLEEFKALIPKMAKIEKTKGWNKRSRLAHGNRSQIYAALSQKIQIVISEDGMRVITVLPFDLDLLKEQSIVSVSWKKG
jgi:hypothetical protein